MAWKALRYTSYVLLIVTLVFAGAWLVLLGYGEDSAARTAGIVAFIVLTVGAVLARISSLERTGIEPDDEPYATRVRRGNTVVTTYKGHPTPQEKERIDRELDRTHGPMVPSMAPYRGSRRAGLPPNVVGMSEEEMRQWLMGADPLEGQTERVEVHRSRKGYRRHPP